MPNVRGAGSSLLHNALMAMTNWEISGTKSLVKDEMKDFRISLVF